MVDLALQLYQRFLEEGAALIYEICTDEWTESPTHDFKRAPSMDKDAQKNLAKALSGYANGDGGLIVWGIKAESTTPDEPDVAKEPVPIKGLKKFVATLQNLTSQLVDPGVPGVQHLMLEDPVGSDTGFAVSYIPSSNQPHMAIGGSLHHYYFRTGSSFCRMPARMVADLHARKQKPRLQIEWQVADVREAGDNQAEADISIGVRNVGQVLALHPLVDIHTSRQHGFSFINDRGVPSRGIDPLDDFDQGTSMFEPSAVLYPGRYVPLGTISGKNLGRHLGWPDTSNARNIKFTCNLYAEGFFERQDVEISGVLLKKMFTAKDCGNPDWRKLTTDD